MRRLVSILLAVCLLCALGAAAAENMRSFFFGEAMSPETDALLNTDPFLLPVSGSASPFDTYYGGFNTITGGTSGTDGRDGWYYRTWGK